MTPVGFEPTISAGERPQTYALDHAATGTGDQIISWYFKEKCGEVARFISVALTTFNFVVFDCSLKRAAT